MLIIRPETPEDEDAIRYVNEEAFGQKEEAEIIEKLRSRRPSLWIVPTTITEL